MTLKNIRPPKWFWTVAIIVLLWNLMGVLAFLQQLMLGEEQLSKMTNEQRVLYDEFPVWAYIAFGISVFFGFFGSMALVMKKKIAQSLLLISLLGVLVHAYYSFFFADMNSAFEPGWQLMPSIIVLVAMFLVMFANMAVKRQWIK